MAVGKELVPLLITLMGIVIMGTGGEDLDHHGLI